MTLIAAAPGEARRPRITNPVSGSVYAIDPDIPIDRQRLAVAVIGRRRDRTGCCSTNRTWATRAPRR